MRQFCVLHWENILPSTGRGYTEFVIIIPWYKVLEAYNEDHRRHILQGVERGEKFNNLTQPSIKLLQVSLELCSSIRFTVKLGRKLSLSFPFLSLLPPSFPSFTILPLPSPSFLFLSLPPSPPFSFLPLHFLQFFFTLRANTGSIKRFLNIVKKNS